MENQIQIYTNEEFGEIRTAGTPDNPLFCLSDVCKALELPQVAKVVQRLEKDVLSKYPIPDALGRIQATYFVNEDGLYDVILDSRKPEAKKFRKWITSEVLPSIRRAGLYTTKEILTQLHLSAENALKILCCVCVLEMENGTVKIGYTRDFVRRARAC